MVDEENPNDKDEYQLSDMDVLNPDVMEDAEDETAMQEPSRSLPERKNVIRNALVVVGSVVVLMLIYKFYGSIFGTKPSATTKAVVPKIEQTQPIIATPAKPVQPIDVVPELSDATKSMVEQSEQKIAALELSQQNVRVDVASLNSQVDSLNERLSTLTNQLSGVSQTLTELNQKMDEQAREMAALSSKMRAKQVARPQVVKPPAPVLTYYIKAIIPGRAWLVATNGSTITVREGSMVPNYGAVRLIDAVSGRVMTSSGKTIRFSQLDS